MAIGLLLIAVFGVYYLIWGGAQSGDAEKIITEESRSRDFQEAEKAVKQYQLAKQNGSAKEACAHASNAFALFGAAGLEEKMNEWVKVVKDECN